MTAYIKYCGGCNEVFSRAAAARQIKEAFASEVKFFAHDTQAVRDIGVLIEGCGACCVNRNELASCGRLFEICAKDDVQSVIEEIRSLLAQKSPEA